MKRVIYCLFAFVLLISTACDDPFLGQPFIVTDDDDTKLTNAAYLEKRKEEFSLWIELLHYTDLYNALNDAGTTTTVFSPNNKAMKAFMDLKNIESVSELDYDYAREIVKVHILKTSLNETNFIVYVNSGSITTPTVFGSYLSLQYGYLNNDVDDAELPNVTRQDTLTAYIDNQAGVLEMARQTANGMVYVLNGVIRPLSETIVDKLNDYAEYSVFVEALEMTGLDKVLSTCTDTIFGLDGSYIVTQPRFTCFAVPDLVYQRENINNANDLAAYLNAGSDYKSPENAMYRYISYHINDKELNRSTLFSFDEGNPVNIYDSHLADQVIITEQKNGINYLNKEVGFIRTNILAKNGLIHKIDHIMPIYEPEPITVVWDFCNNRDIISLVNAYGALNQLGDLFTSPLTSKETQVELTDDGGNSNQMNITSFTYKLADTKSNSWRRVGFMKCKQLSAASPNVNNYNAYMNNLFILNLGYTGWIELKTPTLVKGKYKVEIAYGCAAALSSFYSTGSLVKITMNDYIRNLYVWKGVDPKAGFTIHNEELFDVVEFEKSESHTLKAVMMDIKAGTNSSYRQMWDYIKFTPITE